MYFVYSLLLTLGFLILAPKFLVAAFLRECQTRHIPVVLVNGRLSERSFRRYRVIKRFISRVLSCLQLVIVQTKTDAEKFRRLGFAKDRLFVSGSLKFDAGGIAVPRPLTEAFRVRFNPDNLPMILAASTHGPEEQIILQAFQQLKLKSTGKLKLLVAPRHPDRFADVAAQIRASGLTWACRSQTEAPGDRDCDVVLLDTIGELPAFYSLATIVFVGGSITKSGGHNILEPATVGACIVTGANTHNFEYIVDAFETADAIVQLPPQSYEEAGSEVARVFELLLADPQRRQELGTRAKQLVNENLGATDRTLDLIATRIFQLPVVKEEVHLLTAQNAHSA